MHFGMKREYVWIKEMEKSSIINSVPENLKRHKIENFWEKCILYKATLKYNKIWTNHKNVKRLIQ